MTTVKEIVQLMDLSKTDVQVTIENYVLDEKGGWIYGFESIYHNDDLEHREVDEIDLNVEAVDVHLASLDPTTIVIVGREYLD